MHHCEHPNRDISTPLRAVWGCLPSCCCASRGFLPLRKLLFLGSACCLFPFSLAGPALLPPPRFLQLQATFSICAGDTVALAACRHCPSIHRAVLTLPFCLLFTSFQIRPFWFFPHCALQDFSSSRMVSGPECRTFPLWAVLHRNGQNFPGTKVSSLVVFTSKPHCSSKL